MSRGALRARVVAEVLSVLVVAALVSGCAPALQPSPMPEVARPYATAAPPPDATPPAMPAAAEGTSPAAAKAFVRHWIATLNYAMATGDTSGLEKLNDPRCKICSVITSGIARAYAGGGHLEGEGWIPRHLQYVRIDTERALVAAGLRISEQTTVSRDGQATDRSMATRGNLDFRLTAETGTWHVVRLDATQ